MLLVIKFIMLKNLIRQHKLVFRIIKLPSSDSESLLSNASPLDFEFAPPLDLLADASTAEGVPIEELIIVAQRL